MISRSNQYHKTGIQTREGIGESSYDVVHECYGGHVRWNLLLCAEDTMVKIYVILQINYAVSSMITSNALNAVPITIDNLISYLFMAIAYLILAIVFALRNIVIVLFAAGSLGIAALYLIPRLQDFAKSVFFCLIIL